MEESKRKLSKKHKTKEIKEWLFVAWELWAIIMTVILIILVASRYVF